MTMAVRMVRPGGRFDYPANGSNEIVMMPQTPYPDGRIARPGDLVLGVENLTDRQLHYMIVYKESWETYNEAKALTQWHAVSPHDIHLLPVAERVSQWRGPGQCISRQLWVRIKPHVTDSLLGIVSVCIGYVDEPTRRHIQKALN